MRCDQTLTLSEARRPHTMLLAPMLVRYRLLLAHTHTYIHKRANKNCQPMSMRETSPSTKTLESYFAADLGYGPARTARERLRTDITAGIPCTAHPTIPRGRPFTTVGMGARHREGPGAIHASVPQRSHEQSKPSSAFAQLCRHVPSTKHVETHFAQSYGACKEGARDRHVGGNGSASLTADARYGSVISARLLARSELPAWLLFSRGCSLSSRPRPQYEVISTRPIMREAPAPSGPTGQGPS